MALNLIMFNLRNPYDKRNNKSEKECSNQTFRKINKIQKSVKLVISIREVRLFFVFMFYLFFFFVFFVLHFDSHESVV